MDGEMTSELDLPGFRFHPTEEELLGFYLKNLVFGKKIRCEVIGFLNIYHHDPWDLPGLAKIGEREWYFFVPRDRKHGAGGRPNRTTEKGFWKATGSDRRIVSLSEPKRIIGLRKTLVFYRGRAPRGSKTDWVMNEYRLPDTCSSPKDMVLCKIYRKATSLKVLEQRAAMEEEMKTTMMQHTSPSSPLIMSSASSASSSMDINTMISFNSQQQQQQQQQIMVGSAPLTMPLNQQQDMGFKKEEQEMVEEEEKKKSNKGMVKVPCSSSAIKFPKGQDILAELQVTKSMDWTQDPFWSQLNSPWLQNFSPYANILNFY